MQRVDAADRGVQREHAAALTIAVLTHGDADENRAKVREHGISSAWLDPDLAIYHAYEVRAAPAAILIAAEGRIRSPVNAGAEGITALIQSVTGPPLQMILSGLRVGADVPQMDLADLDGEPVSLSGLDGDTLVLFWNPGCGFCQRMLDELRTMDWVPRLVRSKASRLEETRKRLEAEMGRPPRPDELANRLGVSLEQRQQLGPRAERLHRRGELGAEHGGVEQRVFVEGDHARACATIRREWTKEHLKELKSHSRAKKPVVKISKAMKRTIGALRQKALVLGLPLGHRR